MISAVLLATLGASLLRDRRVLEQAVPLRTPDGEELTIKKESISHITGDGGFVNVDGVTHPVSLVWLENGFQAVIGSIDDMSIIYPFLRLTAVQQSTQVLVNPDYINNVSDDATNLTTGETMIKLEMKNGSVIVIREPLSAVQM